MNARILMLLFLLLAAALAGVAVAALAWGLVIHMRNLARRPRGPRLCSPAAGDAPGPPAVLLLIAHPDDEAMFFVPTILAVAKVMARCPPCRNLQLRASKDVSARCDRNAQPDAVHPACRVAGRSTRCTL